MLVLVGSRQLVMGDLRRHFRPEFLNRLDDIVLFKPLLLGEIEHIVGLLVEDLRIRLADRQVHDSDLGSAIAIHVAVWT